MKQIFIDGAALRSMAEVHVLLARQLSFPDWYGGTLDALHDCLTEIREDTVITVLHAALLEETLGPAYARLCRVLSDSAAENPALTLQL